MTPAKKVYQSHIINLSLPNLERNIPHYTSKCKHQINKVLENKAMQMPSISIVPEIRITLPSTFTYHMLQVDSILGKRANMFQANHFILNPGWDFVLNLKKVNDFPWFKYKIDL